MVMGQKRCHATALQTEAAGEALGDLRGGGHNHGLMLDGKQRVAADVGRLEEARRHTAQIAGHYENFTVVSWLLPRPMRQHFFNV